LVNPLTVRAFNQFYSRMSRHSAVARIPYGAFFYPLDTILNWNRLY
jgi:hypothetical protein